MNKKMVSDIHFDIGKRIRAARMAIGMSQAKLGEQLGVSFQQVQKYEQGVNRVDSSRMVEIARILGVTLGDLIGDVGGKPKTHAGREALSSMLATREGVQVLNAMVELNQAQRQFVVDVARRLPRLASAEA